MLTVLAVWSCSLLFYIIGVILAAVFERGSDLEMEKMTFEDSLVFKRRATVLTLGIWTGLSFVFFNNSYEWAIALASILSVMTAAVLFSYSSPTKNNPTNTSSNIGAGFFVWLVVGLFITFAAM